MNITKRSQTFWVKFCFWQALADPSAFSYSYERFRLSFRILFSLQIKSNAAVGVFVGLLHPTNRQTHRNICNVQQTSCLAFKLFTFPISIKWIKTVLSTTLRLATWTWFAVHGAYSAGQFPERKRWNQKCTAFYFATPPPYISLIFRAVSAALVQI